MTFVVDGVWDGVVGKFLVEWVASCFGFGEEVVKNVAIDLISELVAEFVERELLFVLLVFVWVDT